MTKVHMILYDIEEEDILGRVSMYVRLIRNTMTVTLTDRNLTLKFRSSICSVFNYSFCTRW